MPRFLITVNEWGTARVPARVAMDLPTQRFVSADDADSAVRQMENEHGMGATIIDAVCVPLRANGGVSLDQATREALEEASHLKPSTRQRIARGIELYRETPPCTPFAKKVREEPTHSYVNHTFRARTSEDTVFEFQEIDSDDNLVYTAQHEAFNAVILKLPEGYFLDGVVPHFIAIPNFRVEPVRPGVAKVSEGRPVYRVPRRRMHIEADGGLTYCGELIALLSPGSVLDDDAADIIEYEPKGTCGRCIHYALIEVSASTWRAA